MTTFAPVWRQPLRGAFGARAISPAVWRNSVEEIDLIRPGLLFAPATITRAQASGARSTALNADGVTWSEFAADTARFHAQPRRLMIGGQRTNSNNNPRFEGATAGVIGSGGAYWTGGATSTAGGLTYEIIAVSAAAGIDFVRLRISGTPSGTSFAVALANSVSASASQAWAFSQFCRINAGSTAGFSSINNRIVVTGGTGSFSQNVGPLLSAQWQRFAFATTLGAGASAVQHVLSGGLTVSVPVDITLDIGWPQLELGAFASSPILPAVGTPAASTRGADLVTAPLTSLGIGGNGACTVIGTFMLPQAAPSGATQVLLHMDNGSDTERVMLRNSPGSTNVLLTRTAASVGLDSSSIAVTSGVPFRAGMSVDGAGNAIFSVDGAAALSLTGAPTSGLTTLRVGSNSGGGANMFGEAGAVRVIPGAVSAAELQRLVAETPL